MAKIAMKRWPYLLSFVLFAALCASVAWWAMQMFKPPSRPVAAPPSSQAVAPKIEAAAALFGGRGGVAATASNYQLKGLILATSLEESVVIVSADGKPAEAFRASKEIAPGVTVKEVHPAYVVLSENGVPRRIELPEDLKGVGGRIEPPTKTAGPPARTMPPMPAAEPGAGAAGLPATPGAMAPAQHPVVVNSPPSTSNPPPAGTTPMPPAAVQPGVPQPVPSR